MGSCKEDRIIENIVKNEDFSTFSPVDVLAKGPMTEEACFREEIWNVRRCEESKTLWTVEMLPPRLPGEVLLSILRGRDDTERMVHMKLNFGYV